MKPLSLALLASAVLLGNVPMRRAPSGDRPFEITVEDLKQCYIAQGDLLFTPSEFRRVATREMDMRRRILVHRGRQVRQVCIMEAVRSLRSAGFSDIRLTQAKSM